MTTDTMRIVQRPIVRHLAPILVGVAVAAWTARHVASPVVRAWRPGSGSHVRVGRLSLRVHGQTRQSAPRMATLLLHGLMASGDAFGSAYDALADDGPLLVPDLVGFGRSMDPRTDDAGAFGLAAHLDALEIALDHLVAPGVPVRIGGHSMGGVVALHLAARLSAASRPVARVVTWGAPLYRDRLAGREHVTDLGAMARLLALDTPLSHRACAAMCRFRTSAALAAVAVSPRLPIPLARGGVLHTWASYRQAMETIVLDTGWTRPLRELGDAGVVTELIAGSDDQVVDAMAREWADRLATSITIGEVANAAHDLPLTHPRSCAASLGT